jgi:hypothetical protein
LAEAVEEEVVVEALEEVQGSEPPRRRFPRHHKLKPSRLPRSNTQCRIFSSIFPPTLGAPIIIPDARINKLRKFFHMELYLPFWAACGVGFWKSIRGVLRSGFGKNGIGRNVLRPWASSFGPNFHPWDQGDRLLLV